MTRSALRNTVCGARRFAGRLAAAARAFAADTRGVSTVEYALIIVAVVAIIGVAAASPERHVHRPVQRSRQHAEHRGRRHLNRGLARPRRAALGKRGARSAGARRMDLAASCALGAAAVAAASAWTDWRSRAVPLWIPAVLAGLWTATAVAAPGALGGSAWAGLVCAAAALAVGFVFYALGWLGGGDGKLLGALALWLGPHDLGFALIGGAVLLAALALPALAGRAVEFRRRGIPFACAVAPPAVVLLVARSMAEAAG